MGSKQGYRLVPRGSQVLRGGGDGWRGRTVRGRVGAVETGHLQVREGLVTAAGDGGQARGPQLTAQWGVSEGAQCVQAEALILDLLPEVPFQRQERSCQTDPSSKAVLGLGQRPRVVFKITRHRTAWRSQRSRPFPLHWASLGTSLPSQSLGLLGRE